MAAVNVSLADVSVALDGEHHVPTLSSGISAGCISATKNWVQFFLAGPTGAPNSDCDLEPTQFRGETHALNGLAEPLTNSMGILFNGEGKQNLSLIHI